MTSPGHAMQKSNSQNGGTASRKLLLACLPISDRIGDVAYLREGYMGDAPPSPLSRP